MLLNSSMIFQHYGKFMLLVLETTRPTPKSWGYYGRRSSFQAHSHFFFNIVTIPCFLCLGQKEKHVLIQAQNQHLYAFSFHISKPHLSGLEMSANAVHLHASIKLSKYTTETAQLQHLLTQCSLLCLICNTETPLRSGLQKMSGTSPSQVTLSSKLIKFQTQFHHY